MGVLYCFLQISANTHELSVSILFLASLVAIIVPADASIVVHVHVVAQLLLQVSLLLLTSVFRGSQRDVVYLG